MRNLLTGLLCVALSCRLFAQDSTFSGARTLPTVITTQEQEPLKPARANSTDTDARYRLIAELGFGSGNNDKINAFFKAEVINGIQFGEELYMGVGTGLRILMEAGSIWERTFPTAVVPLYADLRIFLSRGNVAPYLSVDLGYSFDVSEGWSKLGFLFNPMAGVSFARHRRFPVHIGVGYNSQAVTKGHALYEAGSNRNSLGSLALCAGVTF